MIRTKVIQTLALAILAVFASTMAYGQTPVTLVNFDITNGDFPYFGSLVQAANGYLYGATYEGGANSYGTIFKMTLAGVLTTVYSFGVAEGILPVGPLVQAGNGDLYGTTWEGGTDTNGTIFKITPAGVLTTLHSFDSTDGANPSSGLIQATNGYLYGTTYNGGTINCGTIFRITPAGVFTSLHSFDLTDGCHTYAGLVQATNGYLYGVTYQGGASDACQQDGCGTIFKITPGGALTTVHSFDEKDGLYPYAALIQATDGNLYGSTTSGGAFGYGTIFQITPAGSLTTWVSFDVLDGADPQASLLQATDGNFYGTTAAGGKSGNGTIFELTPAGVLTSLFSFDNTGGAFPFAALVEDTNGTLYGTTYQGGTTNDGTLFSFSVGLGPFVETRPTSGEVGAAIKILGTGLNGATSVTFNGVPAGFTVASGAEITTTVPTGATTGDVQLVTPHGTLVSNVAFRVP
jgi:uncharacterized repeat protein (TIGR03803 family)